MKYKINEIFHSIQFEGARYGTANIFVRFAECNLVCGFCDTEFESYTEMTKEEILGKLKTWKTKNIIFTGGEPALQVDEELVSFLKKEKYFLCVETNGSKSLPDNIDWVVCSPKVAEHVVKNSFPHGVNELKYVRAVSQGIPRPLVKAIYYYLSPAFYGNEPAEKNIKHCVDLVLDNPEWRLTLQGHKLLNLR